MALPILLLAHIAGIGGGKAGLLTFDGDTSYLTSTVGSTANCYLRFFTDGTGDNFSPALGTFNKWYIPAPSAGAGTGVYVRANTTSGTLNHPSSLSAGVWYEITATRFFGVQQTSLGSHDWTGTFDLGFDGSTAVYTSPSITLTAVYN